MDIYTYTTLPPRKKAAYAAFLRACDLIDEGDTDYTVLLEDEEGAIRACGSLRGNVLKQLAVAAAAEGEGLAATVVSQLIAEAGRRGLSHLFLYTKPRHQALMSALGFYPFFATDEVLMMENRRQGLASFLAQVRQELGGGADGAVVCNCQPFTLGHRQLLTYAAAHCQRLAVFVLADPGGLFPAADRLALVRSGAADLPTVRVISGGAYLLSRATFPVYFIKDQSRAEDVRADLDLLLFAGPVAEALGISQRFVGQEPFDPVTRAYNQRMQELLPPRGITVTEIPRYQNISATEVRRLLLAGQVEAIRDMVPETTYEYCQSHFGANAGRP